VTSPPPVTARIGVVIPTHSRRDLLERAIASCEGAAITVVDDSPRGMAPLSGLDWIRSGGEEGFARAVNRGLDHLAARGHTVALVLNDDAELTPGTLSTMLAAWQRHGGVVGAVIRDAEGTVSSTGFQLRWWGRLRSQTTIPSGPKSVDAVSGACLMIDIQWRFDPRFTHGMEDIELCQRVQAAGGAVRVIPDAECIHQGGATLSPRAPSAQRHAVAGHLHLVGGGWRTLPVLALATAQVLREGGPMARLPAVLDGYRDFRAHRAKPAQT